MNGQPEMVAKREQLNGFVALNGLSPMIQDFTSGVKANPLRSH